VFRGQALSSFLPEEYPKNKFIIKRSMEYFNSENVKLIQTFFRCAAGGNSAGGPSLWQRKTGQRSAGREEKKQGVFGQKPFKMARCLHARFESCRNALRERMWLRKKKRRRFRYLL
jgi:hypothetical protein